MKEKVKGKNAEGRNGVKEKGKEERGKEEWERRKGKGGRGKEKGGEGSNISLCVYYFACWTLRIIPRVPCHAFATL